MFITIPLNIKGKILVKEGSFVDFNTPFIEIKETRNVSLNIAKALNIKADKIFNYMKKFVGEKVVKNEIVAEKKSLLEKKKILSEDDGIIVNIDHQTGEITFEYERRKNSRIINAFFTGKVEKIEKELIILKVKKEKSFSIRESRGNFGGEIFYSSNEFNYLSIKENEVKNKIIFTKSIDLLTQTKLEVLEVGGFITLNKLEKNSSINYALIKNIDDFEKILNNKYPYCLNLKFHDKIYFYE